MIFDSINEKCLKYMNGCYSLKISLTGEKEIIYSFMDLNKLYYLSASTGFKETRAFNKFIKENEFKSPSLGYVNSNIGCVYLKRLPLRSWTTGINSHNTTPINFFYDMSHKDIIKGLTQILENNYPRNPDLTKKGGVALSKAYKVQHSKGDLRLFFRGDKISTITNGVISFSDKISRDFHKAHLEKILDKRYSFVIQQKPVNKLEIDI